MGLQVPMESQMASVASVTLFCPEASPVWNSKFR